MTQQVLEPSDLAETGSSARKALEAEFCQPRMDRILAVLDCLTLEHGKAFRRSLTRIASGAASSIASGAPLDDAQAEFERELISWEISTAIATDEAARSQLRSLTSS